MRILHFNTYAFGGAFIGSYRLHSALLDLGIDSKYIVLYPPDNLQHLQKVYVFDGRKRSSSLRDKILYKLGKPVTAEQRNWNYKKAARSANYEAFSCPETMIDLLSDSRAQDCDIIHLHWVAGFIDYPSFFKLVRKPVIWTLRDLNPFSGCFHYESDLSKNPDLAEMNQKFVNIKTKSLTLAQTNPYIVGISEWITNKSKTSEIFKNSEHFTINNALNAQIYDTFTKTEAREKLSINKTLKVLSFVSYHQNNDRKGLHLLIQALEKLEELDNILLITAGSPSGDLLSSYTGHHIDFGFLSTEDLIPFYTASDAFIFPSTEEAFGNVIIESMACGTPVISFPTGGALDVIQHGIDGLISNKISSESLHQVISEFISGFHKLDPAITKSKIATHYNLEVLGNKYLHLYQKALRSNPQNVFLPD